MRRGRPSNNSQRARVGITVMVDPMLLDEIVENIEGNSRSEILRKCITEGYQILSKKEARQKGKGELAHPPQPPLR